MPTGTAITEVLVKPKAGWTAAVTKGAPAKPVTTESGEAVTQVVSRVSWIEAPVAGQEEPEHAAPVLALGDADESSSAHSVAAAGDMTPTASESADGSSDALGLTGIVLAPIALVCAALALLRSRTRGASRSGVAHADQLPASHAAQR